MGCICPSSPISSTSASAQNQTLSFIGKTLDGRDFDLAQLQGAPILINIWASWCEPCMRELPLLEQLHQKHLPQNLQVIALNVDRKADQVHVPDLVQKYQLSFPVILDVQGSASAKFKIFGLPVTLLIDAQGDIVWRKDGILEISDVQFHQALQKVLHSQNGEQAKF